MNTFRLAFYFNNNQITLDNYLSSPGVQTSLTLTNGMDIWIGRGSFVFSPPAKKGSKKPPSLKDEITTEIMKELGMSIQEMFKVELSMVTNEHCAVIEAVSTAESAQEVPGMQQYQRVFRVTHTFKMGDFKFLKLDLSLAGNRPFASLRSEVFGELNDTMEALFAKGKDGENGV